jgi:hypothetical protein
VGPYFQLVDTATVQVCIAFRSDGAILLTSSTPGGTVLATYSGAITAQNTWFAFEFEVIISNTVGRFRARKNGNPVDDFDSGATLNTRPGANSYANKLQISHSVTNAIQFDDILWRSDASSVPWMGDIRCYTRMPASDASVQFARSPSAPSVTMAFGTTVSDATGTARYTPFTPTFSGTVGSIIVQVNTGFTGNMKCSLFADVAGLPAAVLGSASNVVNPIAGGNTFTFGTPVTVVKGTQYWWGVSHDVTAVLSSTGGTVGRNGVGVTYAAFPTANPITNLSTATGGTVNITPTISAEYVNETLQDATASYVYDSTVGHADFYNIAALGSTPSAVIAVTVRGFMEKSDAGTRTGNVQLKSGASTVASPTANLSTSWGWVWRTDLTDPATGSAWTPAAVNNVTIGPSVVA